MELPNAYGPLIFQTIDGPVDMGRTSGFFKIWTNKEGDNTFHMVDFSDGCYRAGMPLSLDTLKAMRAEIDAYIANAEKET